MARVPVRAVQTAGANRKIKAKAMPAKSIMQVHGMIEIRATVAEERRGKMSRSYPWVVKG
jgi:hypothetical protein